MQRLAYSGAGGRYLVMYRECTVELPLTGRVETALLVIMPVMGIREMGMIVRHWPMSV
jgi:hypothetical protein